jgi:SAM-dependent methyltransferase
MMDERKVREKAFHDEEFLDEARWRSVDKFYSVMERRVKFWNDFLLSRCEGRDVLEFGCGVVNYALRLAAAGANVTAIDLSETAIARSRAAARTAGLRVDNRMMDAEALTFDDDTFDLICGNSILHHLALDRAYAEVARTLKPDGAAIFMEPLGHNPLINLYRRLTPGLRTADEHPLTMADLELARNFFGSVELRFFHLLSLMSVPLRKTALFPAALKRLDDLDAALFRRVPMARPYAWFAVAVLRDPLTGARRAG